MEGSPILTNRSWWDIAATLLRIAHLLDVELEAVLRPLDAGFTDLRLMAIVFALNGPSQKALAQIAGLSETIVSVRLARLERLGWVTRAQRGHRLVAVALTSNGVEQLKAMFRALARSGPVTRLDSLGGAERQDVLESLHTIVAKLAVLPGASRETEPGSGGGEPVYRVADELQLLRQAYVALYTPKSVPPSEE